MNERERPPALADWDRYKELVLAELERLNDSIRGVHTKIDAQNLSVSAEVTTLKVEIAMLKVKAGAWGGVAGLVVVTGAILLRLLHV